MTKAKPAKKGQPAKGTLGGYREGAGAKKGKKQAKTIEREQALAEFKKRVQNHTDELFNAQFANATGNIFIYKIVEKQKGNQTIKEHILVTDQEEIKDVLDANDGGSGEVDGDYYIVTTAKPDNQAIDSLLDRTYGKSTQTVDQKTEHSGSLQVGGTLNVNFIKADKKEKTE